MRVTDLSASSVDTSDGTSQRERELPALDPAYARIDNRTTAELLGFVQKYTRELTYWGVGADGALEVKGTWEMFAQHRDIPMADIMAWIEDPGRFDGEKVRARWLSRPHFALLLVFLELLGQVREQMNGLTSRHLEHYYRDVLRLLPLRAEPDRAHVVFGLSGGVRELLLPAGTALSAGKDSTGVEQIYRTERDIVVNRARVAELRTVFVHRHTLGNAEAGVDKRSPNAPCNVYPAADATALKGPSGQHWRTFGDVPDQKKESAPEPVLGFSLRSPILCLSEGQRKLTVTFAMAMREPSLNANRRKDVLGVTSGQDLVTTLRKVWLIDLSSRKGWVTPELTSAKLEEGTSDKPAFLELVLQLGASSPAIAPFADDSEPWPELRVRLAPIWDDAHHHWVTRLDAFADIELESITLDVAVQGLSALRLQAEDRTIDAKKPFEPFGHDAPLGSRFFISHPELLRLPLTNLSFDVEWSGLPADLAAWYAGYWDKPQTNADFKFHAALIDRRVREAEADRVLFSSDGYKNLPTTLRNKGELAPRLDLAFGDDLRGDERVWEWELVHGDFGHARYVELGGLALNSTTTAPVRLKPPWTPKIKRLTANYTASTTLHLDKPNEVVAPRHLHPFGSTAMGPGKSSLFPAYEHAGELYIGLADMPTPGRITLLVQLADGTSDPDLERARIAWAVLSGDAWLPVDVRHDSTGGLLNAGIVELDLPVCAPSRMLPGSLLWLRATLDGDARAVSDAVEIRAQGVSVVFEDRGNAADHYVNLLPAGAIDRLVDADAQVAEVEQPFASFGGRPAETTETFRIWVSERLRHKARALSPWDYERLVLQRFPQIYKARCLRSSDTPGNVDVLVIPSLRDASASEVRAPRASAELLANIQSYLAERAPSPVRIRVRNPKYVRVRVVLGVHFRAGQDERFSSRRLEQDLLRYLSPWVFDPQAEVQIGGAIHLYGVLDYVDRRDYVEQVSHVKLFKGKDDGGWDEVDTAEAAADEVLIASLEQNVHLMDDRTATEGIQYWEIELDFVVS